MRKSNVGSVIYANQALYSSFVANDYHFGNSIAEDENCALRNLPFHDCSGNQVRPLFRLQGLNYGLKTNYINLNQYGQAARFDAVIGSSPDVTLDFEYVLGDGYNEQIAGFVLDGKTNALSKHFMLDGRFGSNFFIAVAPPGHGIIHANLEDFGDKLSIVGIGNAFLSQYAVTAEVGAAPRARLSFDAFNMRSYKGFCNLPVPNINIEKNCLESNIKFSLPDILSTGNYPTLFDSEQFDLSNLIGGVRPADVKISLGDGATLSKQLSEFDNYDDGSAHIQGFTINVPIGNTKINRIGSIFAYARSNNFPARINVQVRAVVGQLKQSPACVNALCSKKPVDIVLSLNDCRTVKECDGELVSGNSNMKFIIKNAILSSESFSLNLSDSKVVDLNFIASVAGPEDEGQGLFISANSYLPDRPQVLAWGLPL